MKITDNMTSGIMIHPPDNRKNPADNKTIANDAAICNISLITEEISNKSDINPITAIAAHITINAYAFVQMIPTTKKVRTIPIPPPRRVGTECELR